MVDRLRKISKCLCLGEHKLYRALSATLSLLRWDAAWVNFNLKGFAKLTTKIELTLQGRKKNAAWRHRGAADCSQERLAAGSLGHLHVCGCLRGPARAAVQVVRRLAWTEQQCIRSCLANRLRDAYFKLQWGATDSPFVVLLPQGLFDLSLISEAVLSHHLRQGWRNHVMRNCVSVRHISINVDNIDSHPLHSFLSNQTVSSRALAWRCVVGAEPNYERLAHIPNSGVEASCPLCSAERGTTRHIMWECHGTQHVRDRHGLRIQDLQTQVSDCFVSAFLQNGWAPAPAPPRTCDWTVDTVQGWVEELLAELRVHPPLPLQGRFSLLLMVVVVLKILLFLTSGLLLSQLLGILVPEITRGFMRWVVLKLPITPLKSLQFLLQHPLLSVLALLMLIL